MISVITPVYNGERFIDSCIKDVIEQSCLEIEHIIIDGGSTDRTVEIIKQYAQKYPHIRWISEKDRGQSDAINKGILMAKSEIIGILNVDDFYEPNVLNRVLGIFKSLPEPSFLVGNCNILDDRGKLKFLSKPAKLRFKELLLGDDINTFPLNPSSYFYHKSLHHKIGFYNVEEHYVMDVEFIFKVVQAATVKYVDETWGNFRLIKGTKTFDDLKSGQALDRVDRIINLHRKSLPPIQQLQIVVLRFVELFKIRIRYFSSFPERILPSIRGRLIKIFGKISKT